MMWVCFSSPLTGAIMDFAGLSERYIQALKGWDGSTASNANTIMISRQLFKQAYPSHQRLEEAARLLSRAFSLAASDRRTNNTNAMGKSQAALPIAVILLRVYFILGTTRLCGNVVRAIKTAPDQQLWLAGSAKAVQATWWYYCGRLELDGLNYGDAGKAFGESCRVSKRGCRQFMVSLTFLVVTSLIGDGRVPSKKVTIGALPVPLRDLILAVRSGDYVQLLEIVERDRLFWLNNRLYLLCRLHLKDTCLRNLLMRTVKCMGLLKEARVPVATFYAACRLKIDPEITFDEVECAVAGLIASGRVRGYISREHATLVLSKKNPFPN